MTRKAGELSPSLADNLEHGLDGFLEVDTDVSELLTTNVSTVINEAMDLVAMVLVEIVSLSSEMCESFGTLDSVDRVERAFKTKSNRSILVIVGNVCAAIE